MDGVRKQPTPATHYETLGVKQDCSSQDIRDAYVELSKKYHPDKIPNEPHLHNKFVQIREAYDVLGKAGSRNSYDSILRNKSFRSSLHVETTSPHPFTETEYSSGWKDESIWNMRDRSRDKHYEGRPYYGIKGIPRLPNLAIAGGAFVLMAIGIVFHYFAFTSTHTFTVAQLDKLDEKRGTELRNAKLRAKYNGNDLQLQLLKDKLDRRWDQED